MRSKTISKRNPRTTARPARHKNRKLPQVNHRPSQSPFQFVTAALLLLFLAFLSTAAQELPGKIRGYKVHRAEISLHDSPELSNNGKSPVSRFRLGEPKLVDVSLTGITIEVTIEPAQVDAAGTIDFLTFKDFRVNGIPVDI